jgi:hypothetical protein
MPSHIVPKFHKGPYIKGIGKDVHPLVKTIFVELDKKYTNREMEKKSGYSIQAIRNMRYGRRTAFLPTFLTLAQLAGYEVVLIENEEQKAEKKELDRYLTKALQAKEDTT